MILELIATRTSDRTWWKQVEWLELKGYTPWRNGFDARWAESTSCTRCGHPRMDYRGFSIAGIVNRSFAVCDMCEHWLEF